MSGSIFEFLRNKLKGEPPLNPLDRRMAKRWVKERLKRMYPELRLDPEALERAYQQLGLEPHEGSGKGGATIFEITLPEDFR
ncbi:MAG: hypothetical protein SFU53_02680 [Terrimicrobiaceae bacterium]|nr:hypothetical protein [Terrimicrobiaceae bacterium]